MKTNLCSVVTVTLTLALLALCVLPSSDAQEQAMVVPTLVSFSGTLTDVNGKPLTAVAGVTFLLYKTEQGGAPLWVETQNVDPDKNGRYTVQLGATTSQGLPAGLFASGEARWLGVQVQGQGEQPRVLLLSVPYAFKALDAETLGGKPASSFLTVETTAVTPSASAGLSSVPPITGSGSPNHISKWITTTQLGNSGIFETPAGNVGIGTTAPIAKFDLKGTEAVRDTLTLFAAGSHPTLSVSGTPFQVSNTGTVTFVKGQTFPGTGTITGVTAGTDLTGGGTSGNVTLSLDTTKVPQLRSSNSFVGNQSVTGNVNVSGNINASTIDGFQIGDFAFQNGTNSFVSLQQFNGNGSGAMLVGDPGCGAGYAGVGFNALSGCNNYSMIGNGVDTFFNRPSGGTLHFRENNAEQVTIVAGGLVGIGSKVPSAMLEADAPSDTGLPAGQFSGSSMTGGLGAASGVVTFGGSSVSGSGGDGIDAFPGSGAPNGYAGYFQGDVEVIGTLSKGGGSFKIDHPLDPANKYLYHSFVESPDMMNIYNGNVVLDANGEAAIELPEWFEALNRDFRYQLTCIGSFSPVYIAQKVRNNSFKIAGGQPGMEVSWQVTGIRQDVWANAHRIPVEADKPARERGYYIHPELYGAPEEKSTAWARHPETMKQAKGRTSSALSMNKPTAHAETVRASE